MLCKLMTIHRLFFITLKNKQRFIFNILLNTVYKFKFINIIVRRNVHTCMHACLTWIITHNFDVHALNGD